MILKCIKIGVVTVAGLGLTAGLLFGTDAGSYLCSSAKSVRTVVQDAVPVEFQLKRAHDLLEDIIPEMQANIRLIAQEEVEIAQLRSAIGQGDVSLADEQARITKLRDMLGTQQVSYTFGRFDYTREQVKEDLARRFDRFKEAEVVLAGKRRLVETREKSLQAAIQVLDRTRAEKVRLQDQIAAMESQHRLIQAASAGSHVQIDNSKLAQTDKLIHEIKQRLDVAERVLAHEARFVQPIEIEVISEADLVAQVDEHFAKPGERPAATSENAVTMGSTQQGTWAE